MLFIVWLAIYIPALPLQAFSHQHIETAPIVVFEQEARRQHVIARNQKAARNGVLLYGTLAEASALCDQLIALPRDPLRETATLVRLAVELSRLTPNIHLGESYGLQLQVSASLRLFGGTQGLVEQVNSSLQAQRIRAHVALAHTARGARWLARAHRQLIVEDNLPEWLDDLGFDNTDLPHHLIAELKAINLHSLADLRRLPAKDLSQRFGHELILQLAQAYGDVTETLRYWRPAECFEEKVEFLDLARETNEWLPGVTNLLRQLQDFLYLRAVTCCNIVFVFSQGSQRQTVREVRAARGSYLVKDWLRLFNAQIERQPVLHEVSRIELQCRRTEPMQFAEVDLFDHSVQREQEWKSLFGLLATRLGDGALRPPRSNACSLPEVVNTSQRAAPTDGARPLWLIDPPRQLSERELASLVATITPEHPERIAENWSQESGSIRVLRDYYVARTPDHKAIWIFREKTRNTWFLQGVFC